jgi:TPR repeat protein
MKRLAAIFFATACIVSALSEPAEAQTQKKIALLIGNADYKPDVGKLVNPHNDVALVAQALRQLGFEVVETVPNAGLGRLHEEVSAHVRRVRAAGSGAIGFLYYSGHGAHDATTGTNYLIPVDVASAEDGDRLWNQSLALTEITRKLKGDAGSAIHFVIFDACRNTLSLKRAGSKALIQSKGFVPVAGESGMLIAYATAEGELASDVGDGAGPYAKVLAEEIVKPGIDAVVMFNNVRKRVREAIKQEPWMTFGGIGDVYLAGEPRPDDLQTTAMQTLTAGRAPEVECDRLAAHADDPEAVVSGVDFEQIQAPRAIRACERARSQYPAEKRFSYQLARAYLAARNPRAKALLEELGRDGYVAAFMGLGFMYDIGIGVKENNATAIFWYRKGAEKAHAPAMLSLGRTLLEATDTRDRTDGAAWIEKAAEAGNTWAMYDLGRLYWRGDVLAQDQTKGVHWIERSARAGEPAAMEAFGRALRDGFGIEKDEWKAADWLRKAAEAGRPGAMVALGDLYRDGKGVPKDPSAAFRLYGQAAETSLRTGETWPLCRLAHAYLHGRAVTKDPAEAAKWFMKAAEGGCATSMVNLGFMHIEGKGGLPKDDVKAMEWFRKATERDPAAIGCPLADAYLQGKAITKDLAQPVVWFTKAAEAGCPYSMYILGLMHTEGKGLPKDDVKATEWFRTAREGLQKHSDDDTALLMLADMYRHGRGGPKNDEEAFGLALKSAEDDYSEAMTFVGEMYELGRGVAKNEKQAADWYRKGSEAGAPTAMLHLGRQYAEGRGVHKSEGAARELFRKAATAENVEHVMRKAVAMIGDAEFGLLHQPDQTATLMLLTLAAESPKHREHLVAYASKLPVSVRMAVQKRLKNAGVYRGNVDGNFGSTTKVALEAYASQRSARR